VSVPGRAAAAGGRAACALPYHDARSVPGSAPGCADR